jgi:hypothetical protein
VTSPLLSPKHLAFLRALERGDAWDEACSDLAVVFQCLLAGWISKGELTAKGREVLRQAMTELSRVN